MNEERHIWELMENAPIEIRARISEEFKKRLLGNLPENKSKIIKWLNKSEFANISKTTLNYARWFNWFKYGDVEIPLWVLMELSKYAKINRQELEKNIVFYKQSNTPKAVAIRKPILPIRLTPEFVSLSAHFCFDGSLPNDGKGSYYSQQNIEQANNFIQKIKNCFGEVPTKIGRDNKGVYKVRAPRLVGEICRHVGEFGTFDSAKTRMPTSINSKRELRLAFLATAIVDEGSIGTEYTQLLLKNKKMIEDLYRICFDLGYDCTQPKLKKGGNEVYYFYIKSIHKLHKAVNTLTEKYPTISFGFKEDKVQYLLSSKKFIRGKHTEETADSRKKQILENLENSKTSFELAKLMPVPARAIRRHLLKLLEEGKIKRRKIKHAYLYQVPHCSNATLNSL